jgi:hypothetical protein
MPLSHTSARWQELISSYCALPVKGGLNNKMAETKPLFGMLLSLIGALVIIIASVLAAVNVTVIFGSLNLVPYAGIFAFIWGILIVVFSILMYMKPKSKMMFGLLIIIFAIVNIVAGYDIVFVGSILALIGGLVGWFMGK